MISLHIMNMSKEKFKMFIAEFLILGISLRANGWRTICC